MDGEKLVIEIALGNEAMQKASDVIECVSKSVAAQAPLFQPLESGMGGTIRDFNGNTVGSWEVS